VEKTVTSQHRPVPWSYRYPRPTLHGVGVDAERGYTALHQGALRSGSVTACMTPRIPRRIAWVLTPGPAPRRLSRTPGSSHPPHSSR